MQNIRALSLNEIALVSGGNGSGNYEGAGSRNTSSKPGNSKGNNGSIYKGVDSCGAGIIGGLIAGSPGGPVGMTAGVIGGAIAGQCTKDSFSDRGSKDKSNNYNGPGQCRW